MSITTPGIYDLTDEEYFADPVPAWLGGSLSHSGAKVLLDSPARFAWERAHSSPSKAAYDFGHVAHHLVLGGGVRPLVVDADSWRTKAAKEAQAQAYAEGRAPLLRHDFKVVTDMARALRRHRVASALLARPGGTERALFAQDEASGGVWLRAKFDFLPDPDADERPLIVDYKTTVRSASPSRFDKSLADYAYHSAAAWYLDLYTKVTARDDAAYLLIVQEKEPPHLVSVIQPDDDALQTGRDENRAAIELYAQCMSDNHWPGYPEDITLVGLPRWYSPRSAPAQMENIA